MPISRVSKFHAVKDAKIAKLLTDPAGGAATYGTSIDVPGIKSVTVSGDINTTELRGDNTLLDRNSLLTNITVAIEYAKLSLDVLPVVMGGTTVSAGVTPNQTETFTLLNTDSFSYFRLEAATPTNGGDTIGGDNHIIFDKLMLSSFPDMGFAEEDYRTFSMDAGAVPLISTGRWMRVILAETASAIA